MKPPSSFKVFSELQNSEALSDKNKTNTTGDREHPQSESTSHTTSQLLSILKLIYHFITKYFPKLITLVFGLVFIKLYISKLFPSFQVWRNFSNNFSSENSSPHHHGGMISHTSQNPYYNFIPSNSNDIAHEVKMELYGHYVNPITGLPSFPDYITQDEMQLEELRRMDGTNDWMNTSHVRTRSSRR
ncbi:hypothetical protein C9374_007706 [Naegleria lovaniensis]|uniref:Uncharacterized protein n=1 Tax=Naegleria lovaniensis TaxID=51637 RepID=A0AA88GI80_NAELO|nr:uncharacterized protein C9374_007706 [Naegleria lovaniensis]KAG2379068.1 hypothetical protein C9374_007706 [Naegleria lovaniensis]